jgi:hypothetical protein
VSTNEPQKLKKTLSLEILSHLTQSLSEFIEVIIQQCDSDRRLDGSTNHEEATVSIFIVPDESHWRTSKAAETERSALGSRPWQ